MKTLLGILLLSAVALTAAGTNITGKWTGTLTLIEADGGTRDDSAFMILKQNGTEITGSVGPNEERQFPITKGTIDGDRITMEADHEGQILKFALVLKDDRITGDASMSHDGETGKGKINVTRVK